MRSAPEYHSLIPWPSSHRLRSDEGKRGPAREPRVRKSLSVDLFAYTCVLIWGSACTRKRRKCWAKFLTRPKGESDFDPHKAICPTREPFGGAVSLSVTVRDERGGSYLIRTAPETTPLFDRTNLHPLNLRLLDFSTELAYLFSPAKKFPFRTCGRFPHSCERKNIFRRKLASWNLEFSSSCVVLLRNVQVPRWNSDSHLDFNGYDIIWKLFLCSHGVKLLNFLW
jgi:hypothetical protein